MKAADIISKAQSARNRLGRALSENEFALLQLITQVLGAPEEIQFSPDPHLNSFRCGRRSILDELRELSTAKPTKETTDV